MVDKSFELAIISTTKAEVAESADALDSKSSELRLVRVQLPPSAPTLFPLRSINISINIKSWIGTILIEIIDRSPFNTARRHSDFYLRSIGSFFN